MTRDRFDVAIVGAGASGTLVAVQLLLQAREPVRIALVERARPVGRGLAYSTPSPSHRLNVPAGKMSGLPGDMGHFLRWLRRTDPEAAAHEFVPRSRYGDYLACLLEETEGPSCSRLERVEAEVQGLDRAADGSVVVRLAAGTELLAERVVLAMGNLDPLDPSCASPDLLRSARYVRNPWSPRAFEGLDPQAPVLLVGTGLTAIDVALSLRDAGHRGPIHAISRHGLLPAPHEAAQPWSLRRDLLALPARADVLLHAIRQEVADARGNWRAVIDALRPHTAELWMRLPREERRRFLRHARTYWEVHRHRMAPEVAAAVAGLRASGQLQIRAAHFRSMGLGPDGAVVEMRPRGAAGTERLEVARVLNCTGPNVNVRREHDPFVAGLYAGGWIRPHPLGLGVCTAADASVLDAAGRPQRDLFAIGPLRRGDLWETTAIPEIRVQAETLAAQLLASLGRVAEAFA